MTRLVATAVRTYMDDELSSIERDYPAWHIWRSQAGRWWATRLGHARPPAIAAVAAAAAAGEPEFALTLDADTAAELRQALASQP
jgi:hypothetical protein